jgi:hypothetical protein
MSRRSHSEAADGTRRVDRHGGGHARTEEPDQLNRKRSRASTGSVDQHPVAGTRQLR